MALNSPKTFNLITVISNAGEEGTNETAPFVRGGTVVASHV